MATLRRCAAMRYTLMLSLHFTLPHAMTPYVTHIHAIDTATSIRHAADAAICAAAAALCRYAIVFLQMLLPRHMRAMLLAPLLLLLPLIFMPLSYAAMPLALMLPPCCHDVFHMLK